MAGLALVAFALFSCGDSTGNGPTVASILVVPNPVPLLQRDSVQLVVSAQTANGATVPGVTFTYASADTAIARVTAPGRVRSGDVRGTTVLSVTGGGVTVPVAVTVSARITTLSVTPNPILLNRRDSTQLNVTALDVANQPVTGVTFTYGTSDTTKATVSLTGRVRARDSLGTTQISVTGGGVTVQVPITVATVATAVQLTPGDTTIRQGGSVQFTGRRVDAFGLPAPGPTVTYESSDTVVLRVNAAGLATTGSLAGNAVITARSGALSDGSLVQVSDSSIIARIPLAGSPLGIAVSSTGVTYVTRFNAGLVTRLNLTNNTIVGSITVGAVPSRLAFNPAGTKAYVGNQFSQNVGIIDVATGVQENTIPVNGNPFPTAVSSDGATLFVTTDADRLYKIDIATRTVIDSLALPATSHYLLMNAAGTALYVATRSAGTVLEVNPATMAVLRTFVVGGQTQGMAIAATANEIYVANEFGGLHVWSLASGTAVDTIATGGATVGVALTGDQSTLYVSRTSGQILVINRSTRAILKTIIAGGLPRDVAFHAGSSNIAVTNEGGWVDIVR